MAQQTFRGSIEWIVVDDGAEPIACTMGQRYVRREPLPNDPPHTLGLNILAAMDAGIGSDAILFVEDDDYYGPDYLAVYHSNLLIHDLFGEGMARYYNLPGRLYRRMSNDRHASLSQTGMTRKMLPVLRSILEGDTFDPFIDLKLWKSPCLSRITTDPDDRNRLHCSVKGLPGRKGIGIGHDRDWSGWGHDEADQWLRNWTGSDARFYLDLIQ